MPKVAQAAHSDTLTGAMGGDPGRPDTVGTLPPVEGTGFAARIERLLGGSARAARRGSVLVAAAVAFAFFAILPSAAQAADDPKTGTPAKAAGKVWEEAAGLQAVTGDTLDPAARIFDSPDYQQQLLIPGKGNHAYVLDLKSRTFHLLPVQTLVWTDKDQPLVDLSAEMPGGTFESDDGVISLRSEHGSWSIRPEPPLIGAVSLEKLRQAKPDYVHAAMRYTPDPAAVLALKSAGKTDVVVFFGTWCTYCKHYLPALLKTLGLAGNPGISVEFFGMSEDQTEPGEAIRKYGVSQTPTFIFLRGGKEIGRIEEEPDVSIEADMAAILK